MKATSIPRPPTPKRSRTAAAWCSRTSSLKLHISEDETILFGECQGSGKEPYRCSCDFARPDKPTHRCSCPSRQFPCKHCLGLMYAYAQGKKFTAAAVPEDVQAKREKLQARVEKKQADADKPKQVNKSAPGQEDQGPARRHRRARTARPTIWSGSASAT